MNSHNIVKKSGIMASFIIIKEQKIEKKRFLSKVYAS